MELANYQPAKEIGLYSSRPSRNSEWKVQVSEYVKSCFETFPKYGEDTLGTKIKMFTLGLEDYELDEIDYGFRAWIKEQKKMPLPADIAALAKQERARRIPVIPAKPVEKPYEPDFYEGKFWAQFEEYERQQFVKDLKALPSRLKEMFCVAYYAPKKLLEV